MKGLLIKDLMIVKKQCVMLFGIALLFFIVSLVSGSSMYFSYYSIAILSVVAITVIAYDETYKWNKYELLLPISRTEIVCEKFILSMIFVLPMIFIESIVSLLFFGFELSKFFSLLSIMLFCGIVIPSVVLPIIFRFGYIKGKMINMIIIGIMAVAINLINMKNISGGTIIEGSFTPMKNAFMFAVIAVIIFTISLLISIKVYQKREL